MDDHQGKESFLQIVVSLLRNIFFFRHFLQYLSLNTYAEVLNNYANLTGKQLMIKS